MEIGNLNRNGNIVEGVDNKELAHDLELKKACREFEAIFLGYMLKSMRKTVPDGGLIKKGRGEEIYREMFDMEIASELSGENKVGLAETLYNQLKKKSAQDKIQLKD